MAKLLLNLRGLCAFTLILAAASGATAQENPGELFPAQRPPRWDPPAPQPQPKAQDPAAATKTPVLPGKERQLDEIVMLAPLATAAEEARFEKGFRSIINDAEKGTAEDRKAVIELLLRRAESSSGGLKQLLLINAYNLSTKASMPREEQLVVAEKTLAALDVPVIAALRQRIAVLESVHAAVDGKDRRFSIETVALAYFRLSELQFRAGQINECAETLKTGENWARKDVAYYDVVARQIARFKSELESEQTALAKLAASPNDPDLNLARGLQLLRRGGDVRRSAPYFLKSAQREFVQLAETLDQPGVGAAPRLILADAVLNCLGLVSDRDKVVLGFLCHNQLLEAKNSRAATEEERNRADLMLIKLEKVLGAERLSMMRQLYAERKPLPQPTFFGSVIQGKKIALILDHSGSTLDYWGTIQSQANRMVATLMPEQSFAVIFVSEKAIVPNHMMRASRQNKLDFFALNKKVKAQGKNDDELIMFRDAFEGAAKLGADTILFLSDGRFGPELVPAVERLNKEKKAAVHTFAYIQISPDGEQRMSKLAALNGGKYRFIRESDMAKFEKSDMATLMNLIDEINANETPTTMGAATQERMARRTIFPSVAAILEKMPKGVRPWAKLGFDQNDPAEVQKWINAQVIGNRVEVVLPITSVKYVTDDVDPKRHRIELSLGEAEFTWSATGCAVIARGEDSDAITILGDESLKKRATTLAGGKRVRVQGTITEFAYAKRTPSAQQARDVDVRQNRGHLYTVRLKDCALAE